MIATEPEICVYGAGSVGCYIGGRLQATGSRVHFIGRARQRDALLAHGIHCSDLDGAAFRVEPQQLRYSLEPAAVGSADVVLLTVKSADTDVAGQELASRLKQGAIVVSLQNGLRNADQLRRWLARHPVLAGMVPFNVLARGDGQFHHGSSGQLAIEDQPATAALTAVFARAGLPLAVHADIRAVQWSKLLLNLNNAINALSGQTLREELSQRDFRRCLAAAQAEALALLAAAGIPLAQLTKVRPQWLPSLLRLPDFLFRRLARQMVAIDPLARSSTWEDLEAGRHTEVDYINGEVVALAATLGRQAPVNARLVQLIRAAEAGGRRDWQAAELYRAVTSAR